MNVKPGSTPAEERRVEPGDLESLSTPVDKSQEGWNRETPCSGNIVAAEKEKLTATGNKMATVEEEELTQVATPRSSRSAREDTGTGEMVSSQGSK